MSEPKRYKVSELFNAHRYCEIESVDVEMVRASDYDRLSAQNDELRKLVEKLDAEPWHCFPWDGALAFGITPKFIGCKAHRSDDPNEYCLRCEGHALLVALSPSGQQEDTRL